MGDETATAPAQTEEVAANTPDNGTGNPEAPNPTEWEPRYKEVQAAYTRSQQENAELRERAARAEHYERMLAALTDESDIESQRAAAEALNLQLVQQEEPFIDDEVIDPRLKALQAKVDAMEAALQSRNQQEQESAAYSEYRRAADKELATMGVPKGLHDIIADTALGMAEQNGGTPDLAAAEARIVEQLADSFAEWSPVQTRVKKSWEQTKRAPQITQTGVPGQGAPDLDAMTQAQRHEWMAQRLADMD